MNILGVTYFLNGFLMIATPIGLAIYLARKFKLGWRLFWVGAATFIISQIVHIPFNALINPVFNQFGFISLPKVYQNIILSLFFGFSAGLFEEISRYAMYRWVAKEARTWGSGLLVGVGHGGIEAIILGLLVLYGYIQMLAVRGVDISTIVTPDRVELAKEQILAYWSAPWYMTLLGALERFFTIPLHLACSILVLQAFTRKQSWWVAFAILFHAAADGVAVFVLQIGFSTVAIEGIIGIFGIISVFIIFKLKMPEPVQNTAMGGVKMFEFKPQQIIESKETLDDTRYQ